MIPPEADRRAEVSSLRARVSELEKELAEHRAFRQRVVEVLAREIASARELAATGMNRTHRMIGEEVEIRLARVADDADLVGGVEARLAKLKEERDG